MIHKLWITGALAVCLMFTGCQADSVKTQQEQSSEEGGEYTGKSSEEPVSREIFAMDTYMTVTAYGENAEKAVDEAQAEIERLDALLSTGSEDSEITKLNQNGGGNVSEDTKYLLSRSLEIWKETGGEYEIGVYPLMRAWGFTTQEYAVPSEETLKSLLELADSSQITLDEDSSTVTFGKEGMEIDLGGIAKGYTSSRIMEIFQENQVDCGLVSLGGNVQLYGAKPDGSNWRVAIQSPDDEQDYMGILEAKDCAVITSGGYERYFEQDGVTYHHIIDPDTGYPADSGLKSVSIISTDGTLADALSTSLFIMGKDKAQEFWQKHSDEFDVILLDEEGNIYVSDGIADSFICENEVTVLKKE